MSKLNLTPRLVDELAAEPGKDRTIYWDTHVDAPKGFCLRVSNSGRRSFYLLKTVKALGKRVWVHLGEAEGGGLASARVVAWAKAGDIARDKHPTAEARAAREQQAAETVRAAAAAGEWTLVEMLEACLAAKREGLSPVTVAEREREIKVEFAPSDIGSMRASEIVKDDIRRFISRVAKRTPSVAAHLLASMRLAYRWAMDEEVLVALPDGRRVPRPRIDRDPTRRIEDEMPKVKRATHNPRQRYLTDEEIVVFWRALDQLELCWSAFARVVLLCGTRRGETYNALWKNVTLDARDEHEEPEWFIPAEHRKGRAEGARNARRATTIPLAPLTVDILRPLLGITGTKPRVFVGQGIFIGGVGQEVRRVTGLDVTIHDLRRSCATGLQRLGAPPHVISVVLGHSKEAGASESDAAYTHDRRESEHRLWLEKWAAHIERLLGLAEKKESGADVLPFRA